MDGEIADLYLTDPPYNVNVSNSQGMTIKNDNMDDTSFREFLIKSFATANQFLKEGGAFYIWHAENEGFNFRLACGETGWLVRQCLVWNKNMFTLGRSDYQWKHEPCLYGWKDGAAHYFTEDRSNATVIEDEKLDFSKMRKEELLKLVEKAYNAPTTVIDVAKPTLNALHPTMKPISLIAELVKNSSRRGEIVFDSFGGSGSTLIACEELGRKCYTCELDPQYVDVIVERWEEYTGEKAVKING
jgi:site-specific DNA-methyltransferase (adenine-specific)